MFKKVPKALKITPDLKQYQHIRTLPLPDILLRLKTGLASKPLPSDVKSILFQYYPQNSSTGVRQFMAQNAPEIVYNNPNIPFRVERLGPRKDSPRHRQVLLEKEQLEAARKAGIEINSNTSSITRAPVPPPHPVITEDGRTLGKKDKEPAKMTIEFCKFPRCHQLPITHPRQPETTNDRIQGLRRSLTHSGALQGRQR